MGNPPSRLNSLRLTLQNHFNPKRYIMKTHLLSTCFCTDKINECREFYTKHFSSKIEFDCGWYISVCIGGDGPSIQFMEPQGMSPTYCSNGVALNFKVADVDSEHQKLIGAGLKEVMPLDDHPWGDRGFSIHDPIGITLYIYSDREPSEEFKHYYKE